MAIAQGEVILEVNDLRTYIYTRTSVVKAVDGISFDIRSGETVGLVGESGSVKTTLSLMLLRLLDTSAGQIRFDGHDVTALRGRDLKALRSQMQIVFQDPFGSLNPRMTIREIVAEPLIYFCPELNSRQRRQKVIEMLDRVGIAERNMNRFPHEFSGGQCQRIGIARALIARPQILLCDEPVSALDVSIQAQVINLLKELQAEMGLTLIFVAHDLGVVRHISDDILVMYMGGMMEMAPAGALVANPRHPYTQALLKSVLTPEPGLGVPDTQLGMAYPNPIAPPPGCHFHPRCPRATDLCKQKAPRHTPIPQGHVACHLHDPETPMYEQE